MLQKITADDEGVMMARWQYLVNLVTELVLHVKVCATPEATQDASADAANTPCPSAFLASAGSQLRGAAAKDRKNKTTQPTI